jgi:ABC-type siderophore export system fused ATPase/permease subunit
MKPNEYMSVMLKALGILLLVWSIGNLTHSVINVIADLTADYKTRTGIQLLRLFANLIYVVGAVGMIVGAKIVANRIDKIEVKEPIKE